MTILLHALLLVPLAVAHAAETERPNVIVLLADDLGCADRGCQGSADVPSPNIDSIAANAVRFTDSYAACDLWNKDNPEPFEMGVPAENPMPKSPRKKAPRAGAWERSP